uniref:Uncharacterized protein n=1 Tax=Mustela putorius furo TaxID=9669 RepID=M3YXQ5_MUSPF
MGARARSQPHAGRGGDRPVPPPWGQPARPADCPAGTGQWLAGDSTPQWTTMAGGLLLTSPQNWPCCPSGLCPLAASAPDSSWGGRGLGGLWERSRRRAVSTSY